MDRIYHFLRSPTLIGLLILPVVVYFSHYLLKPRYDSKEPPVVRRKLSLVGHLIGFWMEGFGYFTTLSTKHKLPIYTLQMLKFKMYVVNSPDLVLAVQRNSKTLLAGPIQAAATSRLLDLRDEDTATFTKKTQDENGQWLNRHLLNTANHVEMLPGPNLDSTLRKMQNTLNPLLDQLQARTKSDEDAVIRLYAWTRQTMGLATTEAIYGRENPFELQPELIDAFWEMHNGCMLLLVGIMPWLVARPAYKARQQLFDGMNKYFAGNWRDDASALVSARYDAFKEHNVSVSVDTIARLEVGDIIAIMSNVVPAAFWVLNYIYADPLLLEKVRAEIDASSWSTSDEQTGGKTNHLNVKKVQEECKLLMATYQEVFRMQTFHVSSRSVVKDTMINDQYLLKKDSMVQIPGAVIHQDQDAWGLKAKFFNPLRFMGEQKHHAGAIRWFGGGATLCPGRHFAVAEIISFVAMFIMRFELTPVNYGWRIPEAEKASILSAIPPPSFDIEVLVETREGFEKDTWVFGDDA